MKKNYKKLYSYAIIMVVCVLAIVLIACLSENRIEGYQTEYEHALTVNQEQIQLLEEEIANLTKENYELKEKLEDNMSLGSDLITGQQAMSDMKDIYELYKSGKVAEAKKQFGKIEPIGFDDAALMYYEILSDLLKK
ncbi:MAG: hypothetical protein IKW62_01970 [Clostridia bacterium]|nr:hypothetical protein [Clostridia bacterium]